MNKLFYFPLLIIKQMIFRELAKFYLCFISDIFIFLKYRKWNEMGDKPPQDNAEKPSRMNRQTLELRKV